MKELEYKVGGRVIVFLLDGKTDWLVDEAGTIVLQCGLGNTLMTCMTCLAQSLWEETEKTVEAKLLSKRLVHGNWVFASCLEV